MRTEQAREDLAHTAQAAGPPHGGTELPASQGWSSLGCKGWGWRETNLLSPTRGAGAGLPLSRYAHPYSSGSAWAPCLSASLSRGSGLETF